VFPIFGSISAGVGAVVLLEGLYLRRKARRQQEWPTVKGVVLTATMVRSRDSEGPSYNPSVTYNYSVAGKNYRGDRTDAARDMGYPEKQVRHYLERHAVGAAVNVHYDPADPARSTLDPEEAGCNSLLACAIGAVFLLVGLVMLALGK